MKSVNIFFNSATTKLISHLKSESPFACATESVDAHETNRLKSKLKATKESHAFAKETGNLERAKNKMKAVETLEDEIEACYDEVDRV